MWMNSEITSKPRSRQASHMSTGCLSAQPCAMTVAGLSQRSQAGANVYLDRSTGSRAVWVDIQVRIHRALSAFGLLAGGFGFLLDPLGVQPVTGDAEPFGELALGHLDPRLNACGFIGFGQLNGFE